MAGAAQKMQRAGEDRYQLQELGYLDRTGHFEPEFLYYAVFDGHGGARMMGPNHVAHYAESHLHTRLASALSTIDRSNPALVEAKLKEAVIAFDRELHRLHKLYGTTATIVLRDLRWRLIYLINLGDSRAIVTNQNTGEIIITTMDHDPGLEDERLRIEAAGGFVSSAYGMHRVNGMLALSRALGDFELKSTPELKYDPVKGPVSASPDVITIPDDPRYGLILTSDAPYERDRYTDADLVVMATRGFQAGKTPRQIALDMVRVISPNTTDDVSIIIG
jgi:serine/threonine protein phosphatase PrpC